MTEALCFLISETGWSIEYIMGLDFFQVRTALEGLAKIAKARAGCL
jgi:hypothetical protein